MPILKRVRVIRKIQKGGAWRFVSLKREGKRYVWDPRPGTNYLEWWDGGQGLREVAGGAPSRVIAARRRKQLELGGDSPGDSAVAPHAKEKPTSSTLIADGKKMFLAHIQGHSPDKPETLRRYRQVLDHFERLIGHRRTVEAIARADIDDYKIRRQQEQSLRHKHLITPSTINFEVSTLRTYFYYLINERGVKTDNPCARFKHLRDAKNKAGRRPILRDSSTR